MVITPWDGGTQLFEHALNVRSAIHESVASNIANEETPGYRAMHLPFKEALNSAISGKGRMMPGLSHPRHIPVTYQGDRAFLQVTKSVMGSGPDGNTVHLEQEMTRMAENSFLYMAVSQFLAGRFDGWRNAINEGR